MKNALIFSMAILFLLPAAESAFAQREAGPDRWQTLETETRNLIRSRQYEEAGASAREMVKCAEETYGSYDEKVAVSLTTLAEVYVLEGRAGFDLYVAALDIWETIPAPDPRGLKMTVESLTNLYGKWRMTRERSALVERAGLLNERIRLKRPPKKPASTVPNQFTILSRPVPSEEAAITEYWDKLQRAAGDLRQAKDWVRAEAVAKKAVEVIQTSQNPNEFPRVSNALRMLAQIYLDQGKGALAEPLLERALKIVKTVFERYEKSVVAAVDLLAKAYEAQDKHQQAKAIRTGPPRDALPEFEHRTKIGHPAWARLVNNAPLITKSQRGALFGKVSVRVSSSIDKDFNGPDISTVDAKVNQILKQKGIIDDARSQTTLFVHYQVREKFVVIRGVPVGSIFGVTVEARLVRRGYVFHNDKAYPVVAVLARWLSYGTATVASKGDILSHVNTAVNSLFGRDPFPRVEGQETKTLLTGKSVDALQESRASFLKAAVTHGKAVVAGVGSLDSLPAGDPMKESPIWAPPYANVYGNPFAAGLPYHFAGAGTLDWLISHEYDRKFRKNIQESWLIRIPPTSPAGVDTTLSYVMYKGFKQAITGTDFVTLFGDTLISHRNVLLEFADNRFVRTPAYIFLRVDIGFTGFNDDLYADPWTLSATNADDTSRRMKGPWLWSK